MDMEQDAERVREMKHNKHEPSRQRGQSPALVASSRERKGGERPTYAESLRDIAHN